MSDPPNTDLIRKRRSRCRRTTDAFAATPTRSSPPSRAMAPSLPPPAPSIRAAPAWAECRDHPAPPRSQACEIPRA
jgi:hypothetical protein